MNVRTKLGAADADDCLAVARLLEPSEARAIILRGVEAIAEVESQPLLSVTGRVIVTDVRSSIPLPRFDNSAVDGYGLHRDDLANGSPPSLEIVGTAAAGHRAGRELQPGTTIRILTGARVPEGVAAIVLEERTTRSGNRVRIHSLPDLGANIRLSGEDVLPKTIVAAAGSVLDARHIAMLAASGNDAVTVKRRLRIGILSTGDEVVEAGRDLGPRAIVDSNRPMLLSPLRSPALEVVDLGIVRDNRDAIAAKLDNAAARFDLLITSGGVAGSDADHLEAAIQAAEGVCTAFLK
jgi:molybdopterin molybdotransferase